MKYYILFSILIFKPEECWTLLRIETEYLTESKSCSIKVMSSARRLILISLLSTLIPFLFLSDLIFVASVSKAKINKYAERGQPYLTPRCNLNNLPEGPLFNLHQHNMGQT